MASQKTRKTSPKGQSKKKYMVIVESPAKSKTIGKILGRDYDIRASIGHIYNLPERQLGVDIANGFEPTYEIIPGKEKVVAELKRVAKKVDKVFLATDLDREGEAIAAHLVDALEIPEHKALRVIFNEITPPAIRKAFEAPGKISSAKVDAQKARRVLDRLVGYKISPLLWRKIKKGLSAGRVQSVALRLVVEREKEIRAFVPREYWEVEATFGAQKGTFTAKLAKMGGQKAELPNEEAIQTFLKSQEGVSYQVVKVTKKERRVSPLPPFITSTLQQSASSRLGFSPKRTMTLAQELYEGVEIGSEGSVGLITYMRTDSVNVSPVAQKEAREFIKTVYGSSYVPPRAPKYKSRGSAQEAHEAIRPTSVHRRPEDVKAYLSRDQYRLYKLIWERFVASQMTSAKYEITTIEVEGGDALFVAKGRVLLFDGYRKVYAPDDSEEEPLLPPVEEGEILELENLKPSQHFTKPPPRYTEASLIRTLEKEGIGRPSTYAVILSNIQNRKYIEVKKRTIYATDLGIVLVERLVKHFPRIMDLKFTSQMEEELDLIEEEKVPWREVIRKFYEAFQEELQRAEREMKSLNAEPEPSEEVCDKCGKKMVYLWARDEQKGLVRFLGCSGYPECDNKRSLDEEGKPVAAIEAQVVEFTCEKCGSPMVLRRGRNGPFLGCSAYPECDFTQAADSEGKPIQIPEDQKKCEKCGSDMVVRHGRNGPFLACSAYPKCRNAKSLPDPKLPTQIQLDCEKCGRPMVIRRGRRGAFLACSGYPECRNTKPLSVLQKSQT